MNTQMKSLKTIIKRIIFDADDTLWENNIYYLRASNALFDLIAAAGFDRTCVEQEFDELELRIIKELGYGSKNYVVLMEKLFNCYRSRAGANLDRTSFDQIVDRFIIHPHQPKLFKQVIDTLRILKTNYDLFVLTKGNFDEQQGKIVRAGINSFINEYFILKEKNDQVYRQLLAKNGWAASETCMVGNSPKSDINPALRNGMYAVFIPYPDTWKLDDEPLIETNGQLIVIERFSDLKKIF